MQVLEFTPEIAKATDPLYEKVKHIIPRFEWELHAPYIQRINRLKKEKNAVILAHNYMTPEIFHGVADIVGDSLGLAREAGKTEADVIILCGVHFMAETAKLLNPEKTVIIPDTEAGCSLAESITPQDVRGLREKHPGVPVITYVNTSAAVKAECDICCTSGNALEIVESLDSDRVIFLPDRYLAANVAAQTGKEIIIWEGACEVHEKFTPREIRDFRDGSPGITVIAHPECPVEVVKEADYAGSTAQMIRFVEEKQPDKVLLVTECSMSDNVAVNFPEVDFIRPCNLCPYMKKITLPKILESLESLSPVVELDERLVKPARRAVERMLAASS